MPEESKRRYINFPVFMEFEVKNSKDPEKVHIYLSSQILNGH